MIRLFIFLIFIFITNFCFAQADTVYVDEIDTVVVQQKPVIVTKTVYHKELKIKRTNKIFTFLPSIGYLWDISNYEVCAECQEQFKKLRSSYSYTNSVQYGLLIRYNRKRISMGIDLNYRQAKRNIDYSDTSLTLKSTLNVNYFMIGPSIGYKIIDKKLWNLDLTGGVLFSFTMSQKGEMITGEKIDTITDIRNTPYVSKENFLYHFSPILTFNISNALGISFSPHYYFDHNSNVINQSYTEQRNSLGISLGVKYSL